MTIDLGAGVYRDEEPRDTQYHKRIVRAARIAGTRAGHNLDLECGHHVQSFGDLAYANGVVLCAQCRSADLREWRRKL